MSGIQMAFLGAGGSNPLTVTGGTASVNGTGLGPSGSITATTTAASIGTVNGGQTPYTYSWEYVSGNAATVNSALSSTTTFSRSATPGPGDSIELVGVYKGKVTDALGAIAYGPDCTVTTNHVNTT